MNCQWPKCGCAEREQCKPEKPSVAEIDLTQFAGHTPGPWAVVPETEYSGYYVEDAAGKTIADLYCLEGDDVINHGGRRAKINVRLIAAAPDLLAAYKAALARAEAAETEARRLKEESAKIFEATHRAQVQRNEAERQRDEAFTAGAEAMWGRCVDALEDKKFVDAALLIRALPIPAQEGK